MDKRYTFGFLLAAFALGACNVLDPKPEGLATIDNFYADPRNAVAGINAAYAALVERGTADAQSVYVEPVWQIGDVASDDTGGGDGTLDEVTFDAGNGHIATYWSASYKGIYRCNTLLTRLPSVAFNAASTGLKERVLGEAYFLRALNYFNLVKAFGDVPLITEEITTVQETAVERAPAAQVWAQVEADLAEAIGRLPKTYTGGGRGNEPGRATWGAAKSLLAKVYLHQGKFAEAAAQAGEVVNGGLYKLNATYEANFKGNSESGASTETIFEAQHSTTNGAFTTTYFSPQVGGVGDLNHPTDNLNQSGQNANIAGGGLVQAFEPDDQRRNLIKNYGLTAASGRPYRWLLDKYWKPNPQNPFRNSDVNYPILRYADVLLMFAEATNETGGPTGPAYLAVNAVRNRAGLGNLPEGLSKEAFRERVYQERRVELYGEGQRWWDLVRTGRLIPVMSAHLGRPVEERYKLLPIPQVDRSRNPRLTQNPGYGG